MSFDSLFLAGRAWGWELELFDPMAVLLDSRP
jgi:hypothetical protein